MNILITCVGRRNYLVDYFQDELNPIGGKVYVANCHPFAAGFVPAEKSFIVPGIFDANYIDTLIDLCKNYRISSIISLYGPELPILANALERLVSEGIYALVSSPKVINICSDKIFTNKFLESCGVSTARTFQKKNVLDEKLKINEIKFPLIIKPRCGNASLFLYEAMNKDELDFYYNRTIQQINDSTPFTNKRVSKSEQVIFQEKVSGQEYGLDVINDLNASYKNTITKQKITMRAGETDIAITMKSPELAALGKLLANKLGHIANLDVDLILSPSGPVVIDLNPRFGGGYPFSHLAGVNLPSAIVSWLNNQEANPNDFEYKENVLGMKGIQPMKYDGGYINYRNK